MGDIIDRQAGQSVKVIGADSTGTETTPVDSTTDGQLLSYDVANGGGEDTIITIPADSYVELKIGASTRVNRKYIQIQALGRDVRWGFSATTFSFKAFKDQFFILPFGPNTHVYIKNTHASESRDVAIAEIT